MSYFKRFLLRGSIGVVLLASLMLTITIGASSTAFASANACNSTATGSWSNNCQISEGNISNFVYAIQQTINESGFCPQITADGNFGPQTLAAVECFQSHKGLAADGIVGPLTWGALQSLLHSDLTSGGWHYWFVHAAAADQYRESTANGGWQILVLSKGVWCTMNFNHC